MLFAARGRRESEPEADSEAPFRFVLTSATDQPPDRILLGRGSRPPGIKTGPWSVRKTVLHGGKQEGVELITIDNGTMTLSVTPTRGMGLLEVRSGDLRLGWTRRSRRWCIPSSSTWRAAAGSAGSKASTRCWCAAGWSSPVIPGGDEFVDNTGAKAEMELTLHGKIGNIPASEVEVVVDRAPPHRIRVRGVVHERSFFGPKLELATEVSTVPGTRTFRVDDAVTNRGAASQEFQLIYHANFGAPLLEKGATVLAPVERITPMNDHAATSIDHYATYEGPTAGFIEQVYLVSPLADPKGGPASPAERGEGSRGVDDLVDTRAPLPDDLEEHGRRRGRLRDRAGAGDGLPVQSQGRAKVRPRPQALAGRDPAVLDRVRPAPGRDRRREGGRPDRRHPQRPGTVGGDQADVRSTIEMRPDTDAAEVRPGAASGRTR